MARYVTVSIVAPAIAGQRDGLSAEERVQEMMRHWEGQLAPVLPEKPDIILLPEACDRYTRPGADISWSQELGEYYRVRGNRMRDFFARIARENGCYIAYSAARQLEDGSFRNSTQLLGRQGKTEAIYNKNFLTVYEGLPGSPYPMQCGRSAEVFPLDFGRVGCAICFDLNFDELRRQYVEKKPELMLFSSMYHGGFMQQAWAYDTRSWFAGAVAGQDCRIINPVGEVIASSTNYFPYVTAKINLDYAVCHLDFNWDKFRAAKKKYGSALGFRDPGKIGAALLTSETEELTAADIIREFDIELLDDYFARSRRSRNERIEK